MSQQPGWYDDPKESDVLRYWDGVQWTAHTSPRRRPNLDQTSRNIGVEGGGVGGAGGRPGSEAGGAHGYGGQGYGGQGYSGAGGGHQPMPGGQFERTTAGPLTPDGQRISGWGRRFFARLIDGVVVGILSLVLIPLVAPDLVDSMRAIFELAADPSATDAEVTAAQTDLIRQLGPFGLASAVLSLVYEMAFLKWRAATPGKLLLGLRVRLRDQPGPLGWSTSALRAFIWYGPQFLSVVPFLGQLANIIPIVNGLWPLWDPQNQSLNDKGAKTNVIRL